MYSERQLRRAAEKSKKWFDAASKLPKRDRPFGRLIHEGDNHIRTVEKMQSNMRPLTSGGGRPANDRLIARHLRGWKTLVAGWKASREAKAAREAAAIEAQAPRDDGNSAPPGRLASVSAFPFNTAAPAFVPSFPLPPAPPVPALIRTVNGTGHTIVAPAPARADWGELPEAFTAAAKWFGTAKRWRSSSVVRGAAPPARIQLLGNFASKGRRQLQAALAVNSSYPPGSLVSITWHLLKWRYEISCWDDARLGTTQYQDAACQQIKTFKPTWLEHRAKQRKKRTCSMCGKTAPNSSRAFSYCGGCRNSDVPRVDRPRYCSEECQRAHWLAGHMNECTCCNG